MPSDRTATLPATLLCCLLTLGLAACGSSTPSDLPGNGGNGGGDPPPQQESLDALIGDEVSAAGMRGCDWLEPAYCQFPWPNDHFTTADDGTDTGKRLDLQIQGMPMNLVGIPVRPEEWNLNDGFSPGQMMLTHVDGLDLDATGAAPITDIEASLAQDAPILVIDAETGQRHPIWVELDTSETARVPLCTAPGALEQVEGLLDLGLGALFDALGELEDGCESVLGPVFAALGDELHDSGILPNSAFRVDPPALIMRPGINFDSGGRYIVAMRRLRDADGEIIEAPPAFRVYRDNHASDIAAVNDRREHFEDLFSRLGNAGIARDDLYMAWDFTVASARNLNGRVLHMRDEALAALGGDAPAFEIVSVEDLDSGPTLRRIEGRMTVPNYLTTPDGLCDNTPLLSDLVDYCDAVEQLTGALADSGAPGIEDFGAAVGEGLGLLLRDLGQLPLSRLNYGTQRGEFPEANPLMAEQAFRFQCEIPRSAIGSFGDPDTWVRPAAPVLYGHGLLGSKGEVGGSSTMRLRELNFMHCAIDWIGMATRDVPNALLILLDVGNFPSLSDRLQQGLVNWAFMARLMKHPDGLASHDAFRSADGRPVFDNTEVFYDGNSQGGIKGGSVMATAVDVERGSLGVPGMNYSTLLRRSIDFDPYGVFLYNAYPNSFDQSFVLSLIQNQWDRGEANGYARHLIRPDAFNALGFPTPDKEVLLHVALGDHQVADVTAEIMTRSLGGDVHRPATLPDRHSNVNPFWGIPSASEGSPARSTLIFWDIGPLDNDFNEGTGVSPTGNVPPRDGVDPHSDPRREVSSGIQRYDFLVRNRFTNVCGPRPCFARGYVPDDVATGSAGNAAPLVRTPGPATVSPGGSVQLFGITADPDLDELSLSWSVDSGANCVDGAIAQADSAQAVANITADCPAGTTIGFRLQADDGRGGVGSDTTQVVVQ